MYDLNDFRVEKIPTSEGAAYIKANHYTKGVGRGCLYFGLFAPDGELVGVMAFNTSPGESVRASVFGKEHKHRVRDLHRLHTQDNLPKNTGSWFVARGIRLLLEHAPDVRAIVAFADPGEGHVGITYQALNFLYYGYRNRREVFYRDEMGRLRHPRQNSKRISLEEAAARGWTPEVREGKHRYVLLVGDKKWGKRHLRLPTYPYPKPSSEQEDRLTPEPLERTSARIAEIGI